ncbi:transmembrane protein 59-like [Neodiprion virginianus]|uniref:transmembrane protein 59-like n=1 Tax=Neodiprion virginianus TaxID=2961670 RepID=UPI001EE6B23C|nr:transmembrane protein 59-like [Neodiprion virginianus]
MERNKEILIVFLVFIADYVLGDVYYNFVNREDPCITLCDKTPLSFSDTNHAKSCCQRGCTFFNLVDVRHGLEPESLNGTRDACEASCIEAYSTPQDRYACNTGCEFMAKERVSQLVSLFSVAIYVEEGPDSSILLMSPDMPESDILTDPGLRKELLPGWWDSEGFKLPQTYIKTVPIDSGAVDYGIPSDYSGETEQSASIPGSDWLQCASRHTGMPQWVLAASMIAAALSALWLCLSADKSSDLQSEELISEKSSPSNKLTILILDEAPLNKIPPPKYSEIDMNVENI